MGVCSYCCKYRAWAWGDECFSWDEARSCFGITGPDDPKYIAAKTAYNRTKALEKRDEAKALRKQAKDLIAQARRMEADVRRVLASTAAASGEG